MNKNYLYDFKRYGCEKIPLYEKKFLIRFRRAQSHKSLLNRILFRYISKKRNIEISCDCEIGLGLYIGHFSNVTINHEAKIGKNVNIHKNVTIGQENRGLRKGTPTIGNNVYIGVNAVIVGKITIGDDVLISPNSFVNFDVPSHSIVIGNPAKIIHKDEATLGYVSNTI